MGTSAARLFQAIAEQDADRLRNLLDAGADPNAVNDLGDSALSAACDSWHTPENRLLMARLLLDASADPTKIDDSGCGPLFACVIAYDAELLRYLVSRVADPTLEHDAGEPIYDWAESHYRIEAEAWRSTVRKLALHAHAPNSDA